MLDTSRGIVAPVDKLTTILARETLISFAILRGLFVDRGSAEKQVSCLLGKKNCIHLESKPIMFKLPQKKNKKKLDLSSTKKIPQELSIKCVETTDRASERTPQSPSHVPLSPKNGPKVTGSVHVFFFGGGGLGEIEYP